MNDTCGMVSSIIGKEGLGEAPDENSYGRRKRLLGGTLADWTSDFILPQGEGHDTG